VPPITQRLAVLIAVVVVALAGLGYGIYAKASENSALQGDINQLNQDISGLEAIIATKAQKEKSRDAQIEVFKELVAILPQYSEKQEDAILNAITTYGAYARMRFGGIVPKSTAPAGAPAGGPPRPPGPGGGSQDFQQTELTLRFDGTFANFVKFLSLVENHESFLRVDSFALTPKQVSDGPQPEQRDLSIVVRISTFHYVTK
jgi:hypothetical protein